MQIRKKNNYYYNREIIYLGFFLHFVMAGGR